MLSSLDQDATCVVDIRPILVLYPSWIQSGSGAKLKDLLLRGSLSGEPRYASNLWADDEGIFSEIFMFLSSFIGSCGLRGVSVSGPVPAAQPDGRGPASEAAGGPAQLSEVVHQHDGRGQEALQVLLPAPGGKLTEVLEVVHGVGDQIH